MPLMKRTILVSGASRGIGLGIARAALEHGMRVILLAQHDAELKSAAEKLFAEGFSAGDIEIEVLDLADGDQIIRRVPTFASLQSGLFGLVNCAAIEILKPFNEFTPQDLDLTWRVNMLAPILMTQACYPFLKIAKGSVVNISSTADNSYSRLYSVYGASKAFLNSLSCHAAREFGFDGVRMNVISPGGVDTPLMREVLESGVFDREEVRQEMQRIPVEQRWATIEEIAHAAMFALEGPRYLHGSDLRVHGGSAI
jgi:NAD(P)-dependent dehydrogenase (short-subunit alcohol dehydrogenase family)